MNKNPIIELYCRGQVSPNDKLTANREELERLRDWCDQELAALDSKRWSIADKILAVFMSVLFLMGTIILPAYQWVKNGNSLPFVTGLLAAVVLVGLACFLPKAVRIIIEQEGKQTYE